MVLMLTHFFRDGLNEEYLFISMQSWWKYKGSPTRAVRLSSLNLQKGPAIGSSLRLQSAHILFEGSKSGGRRCLISSKLSI